MGPISVIALASSILKTTGLGEKVGKWIGGSDGEKAAQKILDVAQEVTGAETPTTAERMIAQDPALAADLKKALMIHEKDILELHLEDVQDAREMQKAAMDNDDKFISRYVLYFATFWSVVGALYIFGITFFPVPEGSQRFADTALGFILGTIIAQILNFFFGSSKGSSDKTRVMKEQLMRMIGK